MKRKINHRIRFNEALSQSRKMVFFRNLPIIICMASNDSDRKKRVEIGLHVGMWFQLPCACVIKIGYIDFNHFVAVHFDNTKHELREHHHLTTKSMGEKRREMQTFNWIVFASWFNQLAACSLCYFVASDIINLMIKYYLQPTKTQKGKKSRAFDYKVEHCSECERTFQRRPCGKQINLFFCNNLLFIQREL